MGWSLFQVLGGLAWASLPLFAISCISGTLMIMIQAIFGGDKPLAWVCRIVSVIYGGWLYWDWNSPWNGRDKRSKILFKVLRPILDCAHDYFSPRLIMDFDNSNLLIPTGPIMFGCHPHGILSLGVLSVFGITGGTRIFHEKVTVLTLDLHFYIPLWRELCMALGFASVSSRSYSALLKRRKEIAVVIGGARESLDSRRGEMELTIKRRRGFFRMALKYGATICPVLTFGETDLYHTIQSPMLKRVQEGLLRWMSFAIPVFWGKFGMLPAPLPLVTAIGKPIIVKSVDDPTEENICELQETYIKALIELHEKYRDLSFIKPSKLVIK
jgi:1-acyl-sn-glycerol-3-phosphate acyltransferase